MVIDKIIKISLFMCAQASLLANSYEENTMEGQGSKTMTIPAQNSKQNLIVLLENQIHALVPLHQKILSLSSVKDKLEYVTSLPQVQQFLTNNAYVNELLRDLSIADEYMVKAILALGQGPVIFDGWQEVVNKEMVFANLLEALSTTEQFYDYMGGVVGYHLKTIQLIHDQLTGESKNDNVRFLPPPYIDIRKGATEVAKMVANGLNALEIMAEIHVVGGAGERLNLVDEKTGNPLPVAHLNFCGKTLLEGLIRDLEAREYLYFRLTGKQIRTPIVLMTSKDKRNDEEITAICQRCRYFGRPKGSIFRLLQPLVPVITIEGNWALLDRGSLVLKPGGHGVVWKLAQERGVFDCLQKQMKKFCLVRQVNNPFAGLDCALLAIAGYGYTRQKAFGIVSCPRQKNMTEGMNVLRQEKEDGGWGCSISNIEYTEFAKKIDMDSQFKKLAEKGDFPANTNIIYANINQVVEATKKLPIPGFLVNMKQSIETFQNGQKVVLPGARLESTMQNITDVMTDHIVSPLSQERLSHLRTFVLLGERSKTMSVAKKMYDGKSISETPEGCFYDLMKENCRLLKENCQFSINEMNSPEEYMRKGPNNIFLYHPALGPLYSIIAQKISHGSLANGSELQIEAAEVAISSLYLDGSMLITAKRITGAIDSATSLLNFGKKIGRCRLENVTVKNLGIDRTAKNIYWKNQIQRKESLSIFLEGDSEFFAKDVTFNGHFEIHVPSGQRAVATVDDEGELHICFESLDEKPSWYWRYALDAQFQVALTKKE